MSGTLNMISSLPKINNLTKCHNFANLRSGFSDVMIRLRLHVGRATHSDPTKYPNTHKLHKYLDLAVPEEKCMAQYIWIDATGINMRSKTKVLDFVPEVVCQLPVWSFDGSSTGQAKGENSDVYLVPVAMWQDPLHGEHHKLVLCETYDHEKKPTKNNLRKCCFESMEKVADQEPWFGLEQEYTMVDTHPTPWPQGWPKKGFPAPQGQYYCGVGAENVKGREIVDAHLRACLHIGLTMSGSNAEVMPSQWEFQVGPVEGIAAPDELWIARYLLVRIAEEVGVAISFDPKPVKGDWNGAGGHVNFSTKKMREENGIVEIEKALQKLEKNHADHIAVYDPKGGKDNERRLTGFHETSSMDKFTWGVANRSVSARITREVADNKKGYLEDRRPSSNADPYAVCNALVCTILLE